MDVIVWIALCLSVCLLVVFVFENLNTSRNLKSGAVVNKNPSSVGYGNSINDHSEDITNSDFRKSNC